MPADFIDVAEQSGLMTPLGNRVLALAVAQCRAWLDQGIQRPVAVNVSPSQFVEPDFVPGLLDQLARAGVPAELLSIEITESIAMTDFEQNVARLTTLRQAGVRVAIDDFGIGYSNLSQLTRLPMDELKIDRSLIRDIGVSDRSEAIIRAILSMAHAMGYRTIAEGIETPRQLAFLRALGCTALQGYLFGRPMPAAQLEVWSRERRVDPLASQVEPA
jgi:two-component system CheB/CheR fusion protein